MSLNNGGKPNEKLRIGVAIEETWAFFREIYADLQENFETTLFERRTSPVALFSARINRYLFDHDLQELLLQNDVVFFEWASELLAAATRMPKTCGIVVRMHRYEMYRWVEHINWQVVDRLIVVTEAKKREFLAHFPQMTGRVVVIPEAVSLDRFTRFEKPFTGQIGTLCSLIPRKRVYELILAFAELHRQHSELHLHIGGPEREIFAEYAAALYTLVRQLGLQDAVTFYGRVEDAPAWYRKLDIFVSNSYSEGLQVALLEAMASGIYCLSHAWEGVEELLPLDFQFHTERELITRIEAYLQMPEAQRATKKDQMLSLVAGKSDIQAVVKQVRTVVAEVGAAVRQEKQAPA